MRLKAGFSGYGCDRSSKDEHGVFYRLLVLAVRILFTVRRMSNRDSSVFDFGVGTNPKPLLRTATVPSGTGSPASTSITTLPSSRAFLAAFSTVRFRWLLRLL